MRRPTQSCLSFFGSEALDAQLRFPTPTRGLESELQTGQPSDKKLRQFLASCSQWRDRLLAWLDSKEDAEDRDQLLTSRGQLYLRRFLSPEWAPGTQESAAALPYNVQPFPLEALEGPLPPLESVFEILRWRAGFVDLLSDIWDVEGPPELGQLDCAVLEKLLTPAKGRNRCLYCLMPLGGDEARHYNVGCPLLLHVRAKWPKDTFGGTESV